MVAVAAASTWSGAVMSQTMSPPGARSHTTTSMCAAR